MLEDLRGKALEYLRRNKMLACLRGAKPLFFIISPSPL